MPDFSPGSVNVGGGSDHSNLVTGSQNLILQAERIILQSASQARANQLDPTRMLRVLTVLAAPVLDRAGGSPPALNLTQEWHELSQRVRRSQAPILLIRLTPPTLSGLRGALSPSAAEQGLLPQVLHFSGHAWAGGVLLEDELGFVHPVSTGELVAALHGLPRPLDLVVLNGCRSAAHVRSVAQSLVENGLARAAVGHSRNVRDAEAVAFAAALYEELTHGFPLREAWQRAKGHVTTHEVILMGDGDVRFGGLERGAPWVDDRYPRGNLPPRPPLFLGRGAELVQIAEYLTTPPLVLSLAGPSGIGKTALLQEAAYRNSWRFPGGVAWADPRGGTPRQEVTLDELLDQLAGGLGLDPKPGRIEDALIAHTIHQPTLLLLDNLEGLSPAALARLARFLNRLGSESAALLGTRTPSTPVEDLNTARQMTLHRGLAKDPAVIYAMTLAERRKVRLKARDAALIVRAVDGHPQLITLLVAQARRRDLRSLLEEVRRREGDLQAQLEKVYSWSEARLQELGHLEAWRALLLFPAEVAPEGVLFAAAGREGAESLREAGLADFDPQQQSWQWHSSVAEYAREHWPLEDVTRLAELLPAWEAWLARLEPKTPETARQLEAQQGNLARLLQVARWPEGAAVRPFLAALRRCIPAPDRTLALRPLEETLYRVRLTLAEGKKERAAASFMLGYALSALGRREEALAATQEAVAIRRELAEAHPAAFRPDLASSLGNLGNQLSDLGQREEALVATQEAAALYRELAEAHPAAFRPDLAASLGNLGIGLSALGRREEALAATQEAVALYRELAEAHPAAFRPNLASSLHNLGRDLSDLGRREEALAATQEAVAIRRELAEAHPVAFRPNLAASLNNLGAMLSDLGQREEALAATQEAVAIRRELAEAHPAAFRPDLASSLNNLGIWLSDLGRREEALVTTQEAVALVRELAEAHPAAFRPDLATSLTGLGVLLSALGRREEALAATQEAVALYRELAEAHPAAFRPNLATSLTGLGVLLSALGRREEALAATQEAVALYRELAEAHPAAFRSDLARSLGAQGSILSAMERPQEAAQAFREGLEHLSPFYRAYPQAFAALHNALRDGYLRACQAAGIEPDL